MFIIYDTKNKSLNDLFNFIKKNKLKVKGLKKFKTFLKIYI